tara:strand:+ start:249 stop:1190 length:942 start_codon:yes stop_codon:yes gene_type:complete
MAAGTFDLRNFVVKTVKDNTIGLAQGMVKSVYSQAASQLKTIKDNALATPGKLSKQLQDKVKNLPNDIAGISVAPGLDIEDLMNGLTNPSENKDEFTKSIEAFTGVNINQITNFKPSPREVEARLNEFAGALRTQIMAEIKNCIGKYVRGIINKNLDIFELINFEDYLANQITKLRLKVKFKVQGFIENLIYDKLKLQQIALYKQRILQAVRKICPSSHKSDFKASPTLTRRLQTDRTWEVATHNQTIIESAGESSLEALAAASKGDSTGQAVIDTTEEAVASLRPMAQQQALGYDSSTVHDFVNADGSPALA